MVNLFKLHELRQSKWLVLLAAFSLVVEAFNEIVFVDVPELFPLGDELDQVLSNLCLVYLSSYIFTLSLWPKETRDKKNISATLYPLTSETVGRVYACHEPHVS